MVDPIYMDHHATTPVDPRVMEVMGPYFTHKFGNPASRNHAFGWEAEEAVEKARSQVAALIGAADPKEIIFTSGATEADNLALQGAPDGHIITMTTEHPAVLDTCRALEKRGRAVTYLPPEPTGLLDPAKLRAAFRPETTLVSIMHANNEIGVIQDVAAIGALCRERGVLFHTDATQSAGKIPIDVEAMNVDLLSMSAHKMYGPKGVGALYVRKRKPRVKLTPILHGGGHERGLRSGTLPAPLIVGFGAATTLRDDASNLIALRTRLWDGLRASLDHIHLNGAWAPRLPGNLNVAFEYVEGESLILGMRPVAVSSGSACSSASMSPSHVLKAIGVREDLIHSSVRFGIGRFNTEAEVDTVVGLVTKSVKRLRTMSPLYKEA